MTIAAEGEHCWWLRRRPDTRGQRCPTPDEAKAAAPTGGVRPSIVCSETGHVFGLLVQLSQQVPHQLDLEPTDEDVSAKAESPVGYALMGAGCTVVRVHPFAVQPTLPDMQHVSLTTAGSLQ